MHRLRSASTPIKGLTADILVRRWCFTTYEDSTIRQTLTAELAFDKLSVFDKLAPGQPSWEEIVQWGLSEGRQGQVKLPSDPLHVSNYEMMDAGLSRAEAATS